MAIHKADGAIVQHEARADSTFVAVATTHASLDADLCDIRYVLLLRVADKDQREEADEVFGVENCVGRGGGHTGSHCLN